MRKLALIIVACFPLIVFADAQVGEAVPALELPSLNGGEQVSLSDFRGKIVYVDFWASWCPPCRMSLPQLDRLREKYNERFEVVAINLDQDPADGLAFLEEYPVSYPVLSDPEAVYPPKFGVKGMPSSYILDREGRVRYIHEGYRSGDISKIERVVRELLAEAE